MHEIADLFDLSLGTVHNIVAHHQQSELGLVTISHTPGPPGRQQAINKIDTLFIQELIEARPSIYLDELQYKLAVARDIHVLIATISHMLSHMGLTWKAVSQCVNAMTL